MALARRAAGPPWRPAQGGGAALGQREAVLAAAIAALAVAVFWPIREHAFLNYDDDLLLTRSPELSLGLGAPGLAWAFTSVQTANWFPLTRLSWLLDAALHGLDPRAFHTTDLALHALAAALLFLALARMTRSPWPSAFAAAVFAVHPLHVEPVAWAAGRKDPLAAVCFGAALLFAAGARGRDPTRGERLGVFACLALGLMSKPTLVTLPFLLLLLDDWPLGRLRRRDDPGRLDAGALRRALVEKLPLLALVLPVCAVTLWTQRAGGAMVGLESVPVAARVANAFAACAVYLRQACWPTGLAVFYPHPGAPRLAPTAAGIALVGGLSLLAALAWRRRPWLGVGWLWFLGLLVPTLGLVQVGAQAHADRYTYLPLTGLAIAVAWGAPDLLAALGVGAGARRRALALAGVAAVAALAGASRGELRYWRNSEALFRRALAVTERNDIAHAHLGAALLARGQGTLAVQHWEEAVRLRPDFLEAANNLAWLLATSPDPALRDPERALAVAEGAADLVAPGRDPRAGSRAAVLDTLAAAQAAAGRFGAAVATAESALAVAEAEGSAPLAAELRARLTLYRAGAPFVDR